MRIPDMENAFMFSNGQSEQGRNLPPPAGNPAVLFPRGGELVGPGEELLVRWHYRADAECEAVLTLLLDGAPAPGVAPVRLTCYAYQDEHSLLWTVPHDVFSQRAQLRVTVTEADGGMRSAASNPFSIWDLFQVRVLAPRAGEQYRKGEELQVRWRCLGERPQSYQLRLLAEGHAIPIARLPGSAESHTLLVPELPAPQARIQIVAQDREGREGYYESDPFLIDAGPMSLRVLLADEGGVYRPGQELHACWEITGGLPPIKITARLLLGDMLLGEKELGGGAGAGRCTFPVPDVFSDRCRIEIEAEDAAGKRAADKSAPLTILGSPLKVRVLRPDAVTLHVGEQAEIAWEASGGVPPYGASVYLRANGESELLARGVEGSYMYWTVPNKPAAQARIQVVLRDATGKETSSLSEGSFAIEGFTVRVAYPNGREFVKGEQPVPITWEAQGPVSAFAVNLVIDGEVAEWIARDLPGTARSFDWIVPYMPTEHAHIRVIAYDQIGRPMAEDDSDGYFTISKERPVRVTVTHPDGSPSGDQIFQLGETITVAWKVEGIGVPASFKVDVVLVGEGGRETYLIADNVPGAARSCEWTIAGIPRCDNARVLVEVIDERGFRDVDDSDYYFKIH